jgi:hypothetical protein
MKRWGSNKKKILMLLALTKKRWWNLFCQLESFVLALGIIGNLLLIVVFSERNYSYVCYVLSNYDCTSCCWSLCFKQRTNFDTSIFFSKNRSTGEHFWPIVSVHLLIWVSIEKNRRFVYGFIYSIYQLICFGLIPSILMGLFGVLVFKNIYYNVVSTLS